MNEEIYNELQGGIYTGDGATLSALNLPFWAKITAYSAPYYAWKEQTLTETGTFADLDGGRTGTVSRNPAYGANGEVLTLNTIVQLTLAYYNTTVDWTYLLTQGSGMAGSTVLDGFIANMITANVTAIGANPVALGPWSTSAGLDTGGYYTGFNSFTLPPASYWLLGAEILWDGTAGAGMRHFYHTIQPQFIGNPWGSRSSIYGDGDASFSQSCSLFSYIIDLSNFTNPVVIRPYVSYDGAGTETVLLSAAVGGAPAWTALTWFWGIRIPPHL